MSTVIPFTYDAKAPTHTTKLEDGDLLISGWAMRFDEIDLQGERWDGLSDRLWRSLKAFVDRKGPLAYHHNLDTIGIGRVLEAERVDGIGVRVKAVISYQPSTSPWHHIYEAARKNNLRRFSLAGIFERQNSPTGPVLEDATFTELSICGSSIGKATTWEFIEDAALYAPEGKAITPAGLVVDATQDARKLRDVLEALHSAAQDLKWQQVKEQKGMHVDANDFYRAQQTSPVPLETAYAAARNRPRPTDQQVAANRANELRRQREAVEGPRTSRLEGDWNAALRNQRIEVRDPFDQRRPLQSTGNRSDDAAVAYAADVAARNSIPAPGESPNEAFARLDREEEERTNASRWQRASKEQN